MKKMLFIVVALGLSTGFAKKEVKADRKPNQLSDVDYPFSCKASLSNGFKLVINGAFPKGDIPGYAVATITKGSLKNEISFTEINVLDYAGSDCKNEESCDGANLKNFFMDFGNKNENMEFRFAEGYSGNYFKAMMKDKPNINNYFDLKQVGKITCKGKQVGSYQ